HDALDLRTAVLARVEHGAVVTDAARAEVEPADKLADDDQVDRALPRGAQVGVDVELAAEAEQPRFGPHRAPVPTGAADGAEQDGPRGATGLERGGGERLAGGLDRGAPERQLDRLHLDRQGGEHAQRLLEHLRPDPVAGQAGNQIRHTATPSSASSSSTSA